jgi:hypothetical protein
MDIAERVNLQEKKTLFITNGILFVLISKRVSYDTPYVRNVEQ